MERGDTVVMGRVYGARFSIEIIIHTLWPSITPEVRRSIRSIEGTRRKYRPYIMLSDGVFYDRICNVCPMISFGGKSIESPDCFLGVPKSDLYQMWVPVKPCRHDDGFSNPPITILPELREESYALLLDRRVVVVHIRESSESPGNVTQEDVERFLEYIFYAKQKGFGIVEEDSAEAGATGGGDVINEGDNAEGVCGGISAGVLSSGNDDGDSDLSLRSKDKTQNDYVNVKDLDWSWDPTDGSSFTGYSMDFTDDLEDLDWSWDGEEPWLSVQVEDIINILISIFKLNLIDDSTFSSLLLAFTHAS